MSSRDKPLSIKEIKRKELSRTVKIKRDYAGLVYDKRVRYVYKFVCQHYATIISSGALADGIFYSKTRDAYVELPLELPENTTGDFCVMSGNTLFKLLKIPFAALGSTKKVYIEAGNERGYNILHVIVPPRGARETMSLVLSWASYRDLTFYISKDMEGVGTRKKPLPPFYRDKFASLELLQSEIYLDDSFFSAGMLMGDDIMEYQEWEVIDEVINDLAKYMYMGIFKASREKAKEKQEEDKEKIQTYEDLVKNKLELVNKYRGYIDEDYDINKVERTSARFINMLRRPAEASAPEFDYTNLPERERQPNIWFDS